jgi:hypothetical protein
MLWWNDGGRIPSDPHLTGIATVSKNRFIQVHAGSHEETPFL